MIRVKELSADDLQLIGAIDRSEHVEVEYRVTDGRLTPHAPRMTEIPNWDPTGSGPFSVTAQIAFCAPLLAAGAILLGAFADDEPHPLGLAVVDPSFEPPLAWLAYLHISRPHRRRGAARALFEAAAERARAAGATSIYVSAIPTGSAVGFYRSQGFVLADPPHPVLFAHEPEDIHLVCALREHDRSPAGDRD